MKIIEPKREDLIYKEIENFEDYELTQCIAYEMAIRNKEVRKLLNQYENKPTPKDIRKIKVKLFEYGINNNVIHFYTHKSMYSHMEEGIETQGMDNILNFKVDLIDTNELNALSDELEDIKISKEHIDPYQNLSITYKLKRPKLTLKKIHEYNITINFALPKNEIFSYIGKIRDSIKLNNKTSLEKLISEDLHSIEYRLPKSYADMFFAYDYFKYYEYLNKQNDKELQNKIAKINKDHNNDAETTLRDHHIKDAKESHSNSKLSKENIKFEIEEIINPKQAENINKSLDNLDTKNKRATTTEKHLATMRKYIDKLKYKELITGTSLS